MGIVLFRGDDEGERPTSLALFDGVLPEIVKRLNDLLTINGDCMQQSPQRGEIVVDYISRCPRSAGPRIRVIDEGLIGEITAAGAPVTLDGACTRTGFRARNLCEEADGIVPERG